MATGSFASSFNSSSFLSELILPTASAIKTASEKSAASWAVNAFVEATLISEPHFV